MGGLASLASWACWLACLASLQWLAGLAWLAGLNGLSSLPDLGAFVHPVPQVLFLTHFGLALSALFFIYMCLFFSNAVFFFLFKCLW